MSIHTTPSTPAVPGIPRGRFGRTIVVAVAVSLVVAAVAGAGLWARGGSQEPTLVAVPPPPAASPSFARPYDPHTVYIVGSAEQAAQIETGLNDLNSIRAQSQLTLVQDEVLVAGSDAEAAAFISGQEELNRVLESLFTTENRIVNLRD